jgi:hypothetical protein
MMRLARRSSSSSVARVALPHIAPCVLDLLGQPRPGTGAAGTPLI